MECENDGIREKTTTRSYEKLWTCRKRVRTAQEIFRKGRTSDCFNKLAEVGHLELTMEATIVKGEYAELFTDEQVNYCYELLCEKGYY